MIEYYFENNVYNPLHNEALTYAFQVKKLDKQWWRAVCTIDIVPDSNVIVSKIRHVIIFTFCFHFVAFGHINTE